MLADAPCLFNDLGSLGAAPLMLLLVASFAAGWVDAVVGGGGLIQLPMLSILLPHAATAQILATNKIASVFGTLASATTYIRRISLDRSTGAWLAPTALIGSAAGAAVAAAIPRSAFDPIIVVALTVVGAYTVMRPHVGTSDPAPRGDTGHIVTLACIGIAVGFYDGALGPGTGSFFVIALVSFAGQSFLGASAHAKIANVATNIAALVVFVPQGAVMWSLGLVMAAANTAGGYVGARTAVARGSGFVRVVFLVVIAVLSATLVMKIIHG
ncbi:Sulfite exporter TauE/SafE [Dermatophilus congolensis]|uniref:Probable membrane transporter protein n=1 Tax=Dermatophilus congolensis TaxID=1863 RepID=A0AA46BLY2_9MICO|nr:TSUP family transporter [Dermatophilus congolensis]STD05762.1 Sulfite exporter TauE/SafE [Dermatophilus congolensis]